MINAPGEKAATLWTGPEGCVARIIEQRGRSKMCGLEMEDLINKIKACTEEEKKLILSQIDIEILWDTVATEITRLKTVEENGKRLFGV